jgi:hypothetical protein
MAAGAVTDFASLHPGYDAAKAVNCQMTPARKAGIPAA